MRVIFLLGIFALFAGSFGSNTEPKKNVEGIEPFIFEDIINATLEKIRPMIPDPLKIANLSINLPTEGLLVGGANISNFELTGLQGFQVPFLNLGVLGMRLNFTFVLPSINLNTDYWADIVAGGLIPLYGDGKANVHILDAELQGSAQADLSNGIAVKNLRIQLFLGSSTFDIHGVLDNEDFSLIVSSLLNDVVASFIDNHQELISDVLSPIIEVILNAILSGGGDTTTVEPTTGTTPPSTTGTTPPSTTGAYKLPQF